MFWILWLIGVVWLGLGLYRIKDGDSTQFWGMLIIVNVYNAAALLYTGLS